MGNKPQLLDVFLFQTIKINSAVHGDYIFSLNIRSLDSVTLLIEYASSAYGAFRIAVGLSEVGTSKMHCGGSLTKAGKYKQKKCLITSECSVINQHNV